MKSASTLRRELRKVELAIHDAPDDHPDRHALYGAMTALSWALGYDTMAPGKAFSGSAGFHGAT